MKLLDPEHPMFRRSWVRWVTALLPIGWSALELFVFGAPGWAILFFAAGAYAFAVLIFRR